MEPPTKRLKTGQAFQDDVEEENQDELAMNPLQFDALQDPLYELDKGRAKAATRLKSTFEQIFEKYERDFTEEGDEVDLETGEIIINNGHIESMREPNDDESVSSGEEERILTGKAGPETQSRSMVIAAPSSSNGISQGSSSKWDIPFSLDHQSASLAMAPSPFGAPPPFSFGPFPGSQSANPTWQAPNMPVSLFQDDFGFRNQFMGHPGGLEYNSFGQPRMRSTYRDVFGQPPPKRFSTVKAFTRKALPAAGSEGISDTEEDDILLANPPASPKPVVKALTQAITPIDTNTDMNTVTNTDTNTAPAEAETSASGNKNKASEKVPHKRRRSRKSTSVHDNMGEHPRTTVRKLDDSVTTTNNFYIPISSMPYAQALTYARQQSESPSRSLSPASAAPTVKGRDRNPINTGKSDTGHRKSSPVRKQPKSLGKRTLSPKKRQSKQKSTEPANLPENAAEEVVEDVQGDDCTAPQPIPPEVTVDDERSEISMHDDRNEDTPADEPDTSSTPEHRPEVIAEISEILASSKPDASSAETDLSQSPEYPENMRSSMAEPMHGFSDANLSVLDIGPLPTDVAREDEIGSIVTGPAEENNEQHRKLSSSMSIMHHGTDGDQAEHEFHTADPVGPAELMEDADAISTEEHQSAGTSAAREVPQNEETFEATSPSETAEKTQEKETPSQTPLERPQEPATKKVMRSRKRSQNRTPQISPKSAQKVNSSAVTEVGSDANDENSVGVDMEFVAENPSGPKQRTRDLVIREPTAPEVRGDDEPTSVLDIADGDDDERGVEKLDVDVDADTPTPKSPTRRRRRGRALLAAQKQKQQRKSSIPETPKRKKKTRNVAATTALEITAPTTTTDTTNAITTPTAAAATTTPTIDSSPKSNSNSTGKRKSRNNDTDNSNQPPASPSPPKSSPPAPPLQSSPPIPPSSSSSSTKAKYRHLTAPARRFALTSLIPDDPEHEDELSSILTPTSSSHHPTFFTPTMNTPTSSFRARLGLDNFRYGSSTRRRTSAAIPATTPRRRGGLGGTHRHSSGGVGGVQSSPLSRTVAARNMLLLATPRRPRAVGVGMGKTTTPATQPAMGGSSPAAAARVNRVGGIEGTGVRGEEEEADDGLVRTPGGTVRKCGEGGFVCDREFCFTCCK